MLCWVPICRVLLCWMMPSILNVLKLLEPTESLTPDIEEAKKYFCWALFLFWVPLCWVSLKWVSWQYCKLLKSVLQKQESLKDKNTIIQVVITPSVLRLNVTALTPDIGETKKYLCWTLLLFWVPLCWVSLKWVSLDSIVNYWNLDSRHRKA